MRGFAPRRTLPFTVEQLRRLDWSQPTLNFSKLQIEPDVAAGIASILETNTCLTELNLADNSIRDPGAIAIARALETNSRLTSLNLSYNGIGSTGITGYCALATMLAKNSSLTRLNLSCNDNDAGLVVITSALNRNSSLTTLDLSSCIIQDENVYPFLVMTLAKNLMITDLGQHDDDDVSLYLTRNRFIQRNIRRVVWLLIGTRWFHSDDPNPFSLLPKDIVLFIAWKVWASRGQRVWLNCIKRTT